MKLATPTLAFNPVLVKELRGRMRGPRAFLFLTGVLVLLGLVSYGLFQLAMPRYFGGFNGMNAAAGAMIGQTVFVGMVYVTLLIVCAIAPSLTAGAISGEHQRKTFDLLMATPLAPFTILSGKLGAALSYVVLILLAAIPITSIAYVFGGVTVADLLKAFVVMAGFAVAFAVLGLFFSALFQRTGVAVGASYFLLGIVMLGSFFLYAVVGVMRGEQPPGWILAVNPLSTMASALVDGIVLDPNSIYNGSPMTPMLWGLAGGRFDSQPFPQMQTQAPLWQYSVAIYGSVTLVLFLLATQYIKPVQRFRVGRMVWIAIVLLILVIAIIVFAAFADRIIPPLRAAWTWNNSGERNVVLNGTFLEPPEWNWQIAALETSGVANQVKPQTEWQRSTIQKGFLRVWNPGPQPATLNVTQPLQLDTPEVGLLKLRVVLQIRKQESIVCGSAGDECPVMIRVNYTDVSGRKREWAQGFFANGQPNPIAPTICTTCENQGRNRRVNLANWVTYESPDFFDVESAQDMPRTIDSVTLQARGYGYDVLVARVNLMFREGRPLTFKSRFNKARRFSPRELVPYWVWDFIYGNSGQVFPGGPMRGPFPQGPGFVVPMPVPPPPMNAPPAGPPTQAPAVPLKLIR